MVDIFHKIFLEGVNEKNCFFKDSTSTDSGERIIVQLKFTAR